LISCEVYGKVMAFGYWTPCSPVERGLGTQLLGLPSPWQYEVSLREKSRTQVLGCRAPPARHPISIMSERRQRLRAEAVEKHANVRGSLATHYGSAPGSGRPSCTAAVPRRAGAQIAESARKAIDWSRHILMPRSPGSECYLARTSNALLLGLSPAVLRRCPHAVRDCG